MPATSYPPTYARHLTLLRTSTFFNVWVLSISSERLSFVSSVLSISFPIALLFFLPIALLAIGATAWLNSNLCVCRLSDFPVRATLMYAFVFTVEEDCLARYSASGSVLFAVYRKWHSHACHYVHKPVALHACHYVHKSVALPNHKRTPSPPFPSLLLSVFCFNVKLMLLCVRLPPGKKHPK